MASNGFKSYDKDVVAVPQSQEDVYKMFHDNDPIKNAKRIWNVC